MPTCPKCGFDGQDPESCEKCGIIYDRMHTIMDVAPLGALRGRPLVPPPAPASSGPASKPAATPLAAAKAPPDARGSSASALSMVEQTLARGGAPTPPASPAPANVAHTPGPKLTGPAGAFEVAGRPPRSAETPVGQAPVALTTVDRYKAVGERRRIAFWLVLLAAVTVWWWKSREPAHEPTPVAAMAPAPAAAPSTAPAEAPLEKAEIGATAEAAPAAPADGAAASDAAYVELAAESLLRDVRDSFTRITDAAEARPFLEADRKRVDHLAGLVEKAPLAESQREAYRNGLAAVREFLETRVTAAIGIAEAAPGRAEKLDHTLLRTAAAAFAEARSAPAPTAALPAGE